MLKRILIPLHRIALRQQLQCLNQAVDERHRGPPPASEDLAWVLMHRNAVERRLRDLDKVDTDKVVLVACACTGLLLGLLLVAERYNLAPGWLS